MMAASMNLRAQEVTITLKPGWTWIGYPSTDTVDFATALGTFTPREGDMIACEYDFSEYFDGGWLGDIQQFYPGYGYMYYSTCPMPVILTINAQQPAPQVVVTTSEPMLITAISAMGGGEVTTNDGTYILVKGLCWATHENPTTNEDFFQEAESGVGTFSVSMTGLNISTTYYVRAYAVTSNGTVYGDQKTFTTRDGIPAVSTASVTSITGVTASCGGTVTDDGGLNVTARGVCWSTSQNPTVSDSHTTNGSGLGDFTSSITGLSLSTTYYVRAYASTSQGTAYGEEVSFTTRDGIPTVATAEVTNIQGETAICGGNVTDNCGLAVIARGVCWSTSQNPTLDDSYTTNGSGNGSFSSSITGLSISTTYYVRAYATTSAGTGYGEQVSFTTRNGIPTVTTAEVTDIQGETATCGGNVTDNCGLAVIARGVCWSTSPNPTLDDTHTTNGSGNGSFSSSITGLSISTTYYVRAYATTSAGTGYGEQVSFTTRNGIPTVTTIQVTSIGSGWAYSGGNIIDDGGLSVTTRGVCWSTSSSPTLANSHTTNGSGAGSFFSYMTGLTMSTTYYVRAYATNSFVTVYGNQLSFTTSSNEHVYVDLGLPSGLLWATCNVGADSPEDYGDYFAWGETQPKDYYDWSTYQYCMGSFNTLTKYCNNSNNGYNGFTDNLTTLLPEDDAATANWGSDWRMPTNEEWQELYNNTTVTWMTQNGVNGRLFTASNGNSLFLPAAGYRYNSSLDGADSSGNFWSSSLTTGYPFNAWYFSFDSDSFGMYDYYRYCGLSVRAVRVGSQNTAPTGAVNGKFSINNSGDQVYFSQGNLQYIGSAATPYWKFADNQWDVLGTTTGQNSSSQNVDRDLFGWGTSGYHDANDPYNVNYQPWSTSTSQVNSSYNYYCYGPSTNMTDPNLTGTSANYDWGVYNPISNGGNQANQWRTLTQPEWAYIFNTRSTTSGIRYAKANVNNVNGVILLPDDWSSDTYSLSNTNSSDASYSSNTVSATQWSTLEQAGAVFLPAAGYRSGTSVNNVGSNGEYWSASYSNSYLARYVGFNGTILSAGYVDGRYYGQSVRLVAPAEN